VVECPYYKKKIKNEKKSFPRKFSGKSKRVFGIEVGPFPLAK